MVCLIWAINVGDIFNLVDLCLIGLSSPVPRVYDYCNGFSLETGESFLLLDCVTGNKLSCLSCAEITILGSLN